MTAFTGEARRCLNCLAALDGPYCARCGQRDVDLATPTWSVVRDSVTEAVDVDGRVLRTARAIVAPGALTLEFLRGRRAPYVGPLKLFVLSGAALSTTWLLTRGADARYYGYAPDPSAATYIDTVVRGLVAAAVTVGITSWGLNLGRRRILDEGVFALHLVAALALWASAIIWVATAWKVAWGSVHRVPPAVPSIVFLLYTPAAMLGLTYAAVAIRRVFGAAWWSAAARTLVLAALGTAVVMVAILRWSR